MSEKDNTPMHDVTEDFHQDGDRVVRQTSQHIPPDFLANLKRQREDSMSVKEGELMKVASIPVAVAEKWRAKVSTFIRKRQGNQRNFTKVWMAFLQRTREFKMATGKKYSKTIRNPKTGRKKTVRYGAKGYTISPGTSKGDNYCSRSYGQMKKFPKSAKNPNSPLRLSRKKWRCSGKRSRRK